MTQDQLSLSGAGPALPEGFRYQPDIISAEDEQGLLKRIRELPLKEFEFHGFTGKRRVISYGWKYDFAERAVRQAEEIPSWLLPLREVAARFAAVAPDQLQQALVTEYDVGAAIGWHRHKALFGDMIGVSLLSWCRFRLRRKAATQWERASLRADARSVSAAGTVEDGVGAQHSGGGYASVLGHVPQFPPAGVDAPRRLGRLKQEVVSIRGIASRL